MGGIVVTAGQSEVPESKLADPYQSTTDTTVAQERSQTCRTGIAKRSTTVNAVNALCMSRMSSLAAQTSTRGHAQ
jgi:hypothetical protein